MKMKADPIIEKAKHLGGNVVFFSQGKDGNCGGWVARWIRKSVVGKHPWDPKYFDSMPSRLYGGLIMKEQTDAGTKKAASLMAVQEAAKRESAAGKLGIESVEKKLMQAELDFGFASFLGKTDVMAECKAEIAYLEDLKRRMKQGDSKIQYAQAGEETANVVEVFT
jgi:hypothetical protein